MSFHQVEEWFEIFRQFGYLPGFILLYIRAIIPVFPLALYILINIQAYGPILGILISWLGLISGTFTVYLICKRLVNTERMQRIKQRTAVQRLISFIDRQGLIPLFILLCFPFTPNTLINFVASLSHIRFNNYFRLFRKGNYYNFNASFKRDINVSCVDCILDCWKKVRTAFYGVEKGVTS